MEDCPRPLSKKIKEIIKEVLLAKGYPEKVLFYDKTFNLSIQTLSFELTLPVVINHERKTLVIFDYHPSIGGLASYERPLLAIARLFFNPPPYFAILTNLTDYICIEIYRNKILKGRADIIPDFNELLSYTPPPLKSFQREMEEKLLALYLSGSCEYKKNN